MGLIKQGNSTTFTKIDGIIKLIVDEINSDQEIKRLLTYLTKDPLANISYSYDNKKYYQRDLTRNLLKDEIIDVSKLQDGSIKIDSKAPLYHYGWCDEKISYEYPNVFVSHIQSQSNLIGKSTFKISILVPFDYIDLYEMGDRGHKILERISYLFNKTKTDKESSEVLGDLEFEVGKAVEGKIANSKSISIIEVPIYVSLINCRSDNNDRY